MILNQSQAEAVYSAMCALNNVGNVRLDAFLENHFHAREMSDGRIVVHAASTPGYIAQPEIYADQAAFATAYGLQQG